MGKIKNVSGHQLALYAKSIYGDTYNKVFDDNEEAEIPDIILTTSRQVIGAVDRGDFEVTEGSSAVMDIGIKGTVSVYSALPAGKAGDIYIVEHDEGPNSNGFYKYDSDVENWVLSSEINFQSASEVPNDSLLPGANLKIALDAQKVIVDASEVHTNGDGSDHANVATNDAHVAGNGADHANVAMNDTHRAVVSGNPHVVTKVEVGLGNVADVDQQVASNLTSGIMDGDRLPVISAAKKGGVPATGTPTGLFLKDDGTWGSAGGGGGVPGGVDTQVQYNNSGAFGGMAGVTWNSGDKRLIMDGTTAFHPRGSGGGDSVEIGYSHAYGFYAVAMGVGDAIGDFAIALGVGSYAGGESSIALGQDSDASHVSVAIGLIATADNFSTAVGIASNTGYRSVAVGGYSDSAINGTAVGLKAKATGSSSVAVGYESYAEHGKTIAIGTDSHAYIAGAIVIGTNVRSYGLYSVTVGAESRTDGYFSASLGFTNFATGDRSTAVGSECIASAAGCIAIGSKGNATADYAIAVGSESNAAEAKAIAIGFQAYATSPYGGISVGANSSSKNRNIAIGENANAATYASCICIGPNTVVAAPNTIQLGSNISSYNAKVGSEFVCTSDGVATATPAATVGYVNVTINGTVRKLLFA